jgi:hypothetical protein
MLPLGRFTDGREDTGDGGVGTRADGRVECNGPRAPLLACVRPWPAAGSNGSGMTLMDASAEPKIRRGVFLGLKMGP